MDDTALCAAIDSLAYDDMHGDPITVFPGFLLLAAGTLAFVLQSSNAVPLRHHDKLMLLTPHKIVTLNRLVLGAFDLVHDCWTFDACGTDSEAG